MLFILFLGYNKNPYSFKPKMSDCTFCYACQPAAHIFMFKTLELFKVLLGILHTEPLVYLKLPLPASE